MPGRFHWILPKKLAGMEYPGLGQPIVDDLIALKREGIKVVLSLTEEAPRFDTHVRRHFEWVHFPIDDFRIPELPPTLDLVGRMDDWIEAGRPVAVHCLAGLGRTGTILGSYMIYKYREPAGDVLAWLRAIEPGYVQTRGQEDFLRRFADQILALPPGVRRLPDDSSPSAGA